MRLLGTNRHFRTAGIGGVVVRRHLIVDGLRTRFGLCRAGVKGIATRLRAILHGIACRRVSHVHGDAVGLSVNGYRDVRRADGHGLGADGHGHAGRCGVAVVIVSHDFIPYIIGSRVGSCRDGCGIKIICGGCGCVRAEGVLHFTACGRSCCHEFLCRAVICKILCGRIICDRCRIICPIFCYFFQQIIGARFKSFQICDHRNAAFKLRKLYILHISVGSISANRYIGAGMIDSAAPCRLYLKHPAVILIKDAFRQFRCSICKPFSRYCRN